MKNLKILFQNKKLLLIPVCILLIIGISTTLLYFNTQKKQESLRREYCAELSAGVYDSVFFSMFPIDNYSAQEFNTYRGVTPSISPYAMTDLADLSAHLDVVLASANNIDTIYLGLDPYVVWKSSDNDNDIWNRNLQTYLLSYIDEYPNISFEVLLPYHPMDYWTSASPQKLDTIMTTYRSLISTLDLYSNVTTFFIGAEYWLNSNPDNYDASSGLNKLLSDFFVRYLFCDYNFTIDKQNVDAILDDFKVEIQEEKANPTTYADLSKWKVVFFGDSIVGNYTGSTSISGVVTALSDAQTYNFGIGGTQATYSPDATNDFLHNVDAFISGELTVTQDETHFPHDKISDTGKNLCFIMQYGTNDYFTGRPTQNTQDAYDIYTYAGALRTGISKLQAAYPDAKILLLTPPYCTYFGYGTEINSNEGGPLVDYVNTVVQVATDMNVYYINSYTGLALNTNNHTDYLSDGCHLGETGRFILATYIIEFLSHM